MSNFSNSGAKIDEVLPHSIPDEFFLRITPDSRSRKCRVIWRSRNSLGVEFVSASEDTPSESSRQRVGA